MDAGKMRQMFPDFEHCEREYKRSAAVYSAATHFEEMHFYFALYSAMAAGLSSRECAKRLGLSKSHVARGMKELSRAQGVVMPSDWEGPEEIYEMVERIISKASTVTAREADGQRCDTGGGESNER